jgi:hypothetical protein
MKAKNTLKVTKIIIWTDCGIEVYSVEQVRISTPRKDKKYIYDREISGTISLFTL